MRARTALRSGLLLALGASLLAGCAGGAISPNAPVPPTASSPASPAGGPLIGERTFVSTGVTGHQLVAGSTVTLAFHDVTLSASAGCNTMSGEYHIAGASLFVGDMAMTEMACDQERMAQDDWLAKLLSGATVKLDDTSLTLTKGDVSLALVDRKTTNLPLEGTVWTVDGIIGGDAVSSVPAGVTATLVIRGGVAAVSTGCNWGSIPVTVADRTIGFGPIGMTARGCADDAGAVEPAMLAALQGVQPFLIDGDSLTIGTAGKAAIMLRGSAPMPSAGSS